MLKGTSFPHLHATPAQLVTTQLARIVPSPHGTIPGRVSAPAVPAPVSPMGWEPPGQNPTTHHHGRAAAASLTAMVLRRCRAKGVRLREPLEGLRVLITLPDVAHPAQPIPDPVSLHEARWIMMFSMVGAGYSWGKDWSWAPRGSVQPSETHQTCLTSAVLSSAARRQGDGAQHHPAGPQRFLFACGSGVAEAGPGVSRSGCMLPWQARAEHGPGTEPSWDSGQHKPGANRLCQPCPAGGWQQEGHSPAPCCHGMGTPNQRHWLHGSSSRAGLGVCTTPGRAGVPRRHPAAEHPATGCRGGKRWVPRRGRPGDAAVPRPGSGWGTRVRPRHTGGAAAAGPEAAPYRGRPAPARREPRPPRPRRPRTPVPDGGERPAALTSLRGSRASVCRNLDALKRFMMPRPRRAEPCPAAPLRSARLGAAAGPAPGHALVL